MLKAVSDLSDFVRCYEPVFLYLMAQKQTAGKQAELQTLRTTVEVGERRIQTVDKAIQGLYEANMEGKIADERFMKMTESYEAEQKQLTAQAEEAREKLHTAEQNKVDLRKYDGHCHVKVDIHFTGVGLIDLPTEQEIQGLMDELQTKDATGIPA